MSVVPDPGLVRAFLGWAGPARIARVLGLIVAGAVIEGLSVLMLIPAISIILAPDAGGDTGLAAALRALTGGGPPAERLAIALGIFAVLIPVRFVILYRRDVVLSDMAQGFIASLRLRFFSAIAAARWTESARLGHGRIGHALSRDLDRASAAVGAMLSGASTLVVLGGQLAIALWLSPVVALGVSVLALAALAALRPIRQRAARISRETTLADYELFSTVAGFLRGLKGAKAHGLEQSYLSGFDRASRAFAGRLIASQRNASAGRLAMQSAVAMLAVSGILIGHQWLGFPPDVLIVVLLILVRLGGPLQAIQSALQSYRLGREAYRSALAATEVGADPAPAATPTAPVAPWPRAPGFTLEKISFHPEPGSLPILSGLSAAIPAGQVTAVAGPSGVGKTTLLDLVAGLHVPGSGRILIDDTPFDGAARTRLRPVLAYVGQEGTAVSDTLRGHLAVGRQADDAHLWEALDTVGAADIVRAAPGGLDAPMREAGSHFSGGERQRLRLAAALLREPRLLVLDEATNALDLAAEDRVLQAVFDACGGATILMVSHRPGTLGLAAHVLTLDPPSMCLDQPQASPPKGGQGG